MFTVFEDVEIGTLAFFAFSFLAGVFIALHAVLGSRKETLQHRAVKGAVGVIYAVITVLAFLQLEGVKSPYVDTGVAGNDSQTQQQQLGNDY